MDSTNLELDLLAKKLKIPNYVDARIRDELLGKSVTDNECGIINLQPSTETGSHWICHFKSPFQKIAYSSYGDPFPNELKNYLGDNIYT